MATNRAKPRTVLSLHAVLTEAIAVLDEGGQEALTLRALAARSGTGVSSVYWYVKSRDELLDLAVDRVVERALEAADDGEAADPIGRVRRLGLALFEALDEHEWAGPLIAQEVGRQPHSLLALDRVGRELAALGLAPDQQFHGATAVMSYVVGVGAQMARARFALAQNTGRDEFLAEAAQRWGTVNPDVFPFVSSMREQVRRHDDLEQFTFGLDLVLDGLRRLTSEF